jgi:hypothetical protein
MSHLPKSDWEGLGAVVLRQPRRKEQTLAPVWGRLTYAADFVNAQLRPLYSGPAIILEAINPLKPFRFGRRLSSEGQAELKRLQMDGHSLRRGDNRGTLDVTFVSCRNTQLYRTFLHELGHWVDYLEKVERPAALEPDNSELYDRLWSKYHRRRPSREKEQFAHTYADRIREQLLLAKIIPFDRRLSREEILADGLRWKDFAMPNDD